MKVDSKEDFTLQIHQVGKLREAKDAYNLKKTLTHKHMYKNGPEIIVGWKLIIFGRLWLSKRVIRRNKPDKPQKEMWYGSVEQDYIIWLHKIEES